ncbi:MAG: hypothetical protein WA711_11505, partial [Pseudolabrys sp.]
MTLPISVPVPTDCDSFVQIAAARRVQNELRGCEQVLFHTNASSRSFFEGGVFLTEAFEFSFQSFVEHGLVPR